MRWKFRFEALRMFEPVRLGLWHFRRECDNHMQQNFDLTQEKMTQAYQDFLEIIYLKATNNSNNQTSEWISTRFLNMYICPSHKYNSILLGLGVATSLVNRSEYYLYGFMGFIVFSQWFCPHHPNHHCLWTWTTFAHQTIILFMVVQ